MVGCPRCTYSSIHVFHCADNLKIKKLLDKHISKNSCVWWVRVVVRVMCVQCVCVCHVVSCHVVSCLVLSCAGVARVCNACFSMCGAAWQAGNHPFSGSARLRVYIQIVSVCIGKTILMLNTCGRFAGTHGGLLSVHTEAC